MTRDPSDAYRLTAEEIVATLGTDLQRGLTDEQASERLARYGHNELAAEPAVLYVPAMQQAFGTTGLNAGDWLRCTLFASTVLWPREVSKLFLRRYRSGSHARSILERNLRE